MKPNRSDRSEELTVPFDIHIDREACMGSGQCCMYAPNTFDLDELTIAIVVDQTGDRSSDVQLARDSCPTHAISLVERGASPSDRSG
jgi:ferredoxin